MSSSALEVMEQSPDWELIAEDFHVPDFTLWSLALVGWVPNATGRRAKMRCRTTVCCLLAIHAYVLVKFGLIRFCNSLSGRQTWYLAFQWHFIASIFDILNPLASILHLLFFHYAIHSCRSQIRCLDSYSVVALRLFNTYTIVLVVLPGLLLVPAFLCSQRFPTLEERWWHAPEITADFFASAVPRYATMTLLFSDIQIPRYYLRNLCLNAPLQTYETIHATVNNLHFEADERTTVWSRFLLWAMILDVVCLTLLVWTDTLLMLSEAALAAALAFHAYHVLWMIPMLVQVVAQLYPIAMFNREVDEAPAALAKNHVSDSARSAASLLNIAPPGLFFWGCVRITPRLLCQFALTMVLFIARYEIMAVVGTFHESLESWKKLACLPDDPEC